MNLKKALTALRRRWITAVVLALLAAAILPVGWWTWLTIQIGMARANPQDTRLFCHATLAAGARTLVRAEVRHGVTGDLVPGAEVELKLVSEDGESIGLGTVNAGSPAESSLPVEIPELAPGQYKLVASAKSRLGTEEVRQTISVLPDARVLLTCDKPLYQPEQTIHLRALALSAATRRPAAKAGIVVEIEDPKGNKVFKKRTRTSEFGIAAVDSKLADEILHGQYRLKATVGETVAEKVVTVKRYVLPKFKVAIETDRTYYKPGETVKGSVKAGYFFGKPVADGTVALEFSTFVVALQSIGKVEGQTGPDGALDFEFKLPDAFHGTEFAKGDALLRAEAKVTDTAGHPESASIMRPVAPSDLRVEIVHENGNPVPGLTNRYYVVVTRPDGRPVEATVELEKPSIKVSTDRTGVAVIDPRLFRRNAEWNLLVTSRQGESETIRYRPFGTSGRNYPRGRQGDLFLLRTDRTLYQPGDTMTVSILSVASQGRFYVDLAQARQTVLTRIVEAENGRGELRVDIPPDVFGNLEVHAYRVLRSGQVARDTRLVIVSRPSGLSIQCRLDKETYIPGETAKVEFGLLDRSGEPVRGALSISAVDEAVFALAEAHPGLEKVFFALEAELLRPKYQIKYAPFNLAAAVGAGTAAPADQQAAAAATLAALDYQGSAPAISQTYTKKVRRAKQERAALRRRVRNLGQGAMVVAAVIWFIVAVAVVWVVPAGLLFYFRCTVAGMVWVVVSVSLGIYLLFGRGSYHGAKPLTVIALLACSLVIHIVMIAWKRSRLASVSLTWSLLVAILGAVLALPTLGKAQVAAKALSGRALADAPASMEFEIGEGAEMPPADRKATVRVREFFPETLLWVPQLITDDSGRASLEIPLADSITTWRMGVSSVSAAGDIGSTDQGIRVFQDFFVDIDFPVSLLQDDEVSVPLTVYNYLKEAQTVELEAEAGDGLRFLEEGRTVVELGPNEVRSVPLRVQARKVGQQTLTVYAFGSKDFKDAIKRTVRVRPNGEEKLVSFSGRLTDSVTQTFILPEEALPDASVLVVKLYPGVFSQVVDGLDQLVRMPFG